ncbi:MAG: DUF1566 domain-containing protein [Candidatus Magnetobacterium sp. LHC-1]|nr:DUF1566 domain-containing protein [Nitrospirota bacterium]
MIALAGTINLPQTGQTMTYATGDDGASQVGVAWSNPRFKDNGDQTVTDRLTGLVWTKDGGTPTIGICAGGWLTWKMALTYVDCLNIVNYLGYSDWRLPNKEELFSLLDRRTYNPPLPSGHPFTNVISDTYWSSTTWAYNTSSAWYVNMLRGNMNMSDKTGALYVLPVRSEKADNLVNLLISKAGTGSGTVKSSDGKIDCGDACTAKYTPDASVTLTATASSGSTFDGWGRDCTGVSSTCTLEMTNNLGATATFNKAAPPPTNNADKAIIVAGGGPYKGNDLWEATKTNTDLAYNTLRIRNFTADNIYYLSEEEGVNPIVKGNATRENIKNVITTWPKDANDIIIFMIDHGEEGSFKINEKETLSAKELGDWFNTLQNKITGMIVFVYEACESGSFLPYLKPPSDKKRIIITSSRFDRESYLPIQGTVSFSNFFWSRINSGAKVWKAFDYAKDGITMHQSDNKTQQLPQIDDNGDGIYNQKDGIIASDYHIGTGSLSAGSVPTITDGSGNQKLNGGTSATLWIDTDTSKIKKVLAIIRPPGFNSGSTSEPVTDMPYIELTEIGNNKRYEGTYSRFTEKGTYEIAVFAINDEGYISLPKTTQVTQTVQVSANPIAEITANDNTDDICITPADTLKIDVKLAKGDKIVDAELWLYVTTVTAVNLGTWYYDYYDVSRPLDQRWTPGYKVTHQGSLFDLPRTTVLSYTGLPKGSYTFVFKVKTTEDKESYSDSILVNVKDNCGN